MTQNDQTSFDSSPRNNSSRRPKLKGIRRAALIGCAVLVTTFAFGASDAFAQGGGGAGLLAGIGSEAEEALDLSLLQRLRLRYQNHQQQQERTENRAQMRELKAEYEELAQAPRRNAAALRALTRQIQTVRGEMVEDHNAHRAAVNRILSAEQREELAEARQARRENMRERRADRATNARANNNGRHVARGPHGEAGAASNPAADNRGRRVARGSRGAAGVESHPGTNGQQRRPSIDRRRGDQGTDGQARVNSRRGGPNGQAGDQGRRGRRGPNAR